HTLPRLRGLCLAQCEIPPGYLAMPAYPHLENLTYFPTQSGIPFTEAQNLTEYKGSSRSLWPVLGGGAIRSLSLPIASETREMPQVLREVALFNLQLEYLRLSLAYLSHRLLEV